MAIEGAWVAFTPGAPPTLAFGRNVSSVARNGAGDYSVNFQDDLVNVNGAPQVAVQRMSGTPLHYKCELVSVRQARLRFRNVAGALTDPTRVSFRIVADNDGFVGGGS